MKPDGRRGLRHEHRDWWSVRLGNHRDVCGVRQVVHIDHRDRRFAPILEDESRITAGIRYRSLSVAPGFVSHWNRTLLQRPDRLGRF